MEDGCPPVIPGLACSHRSGISEGAGAGRWGWGLLSLNPVMPPLLPSPLSSVFEGISRKPLVGRYGLSLG